MRRSTESGLALILVLWSLMLLTTIGLSLGYAVRVETAGGLALSEQVRAEAIAAAGVRRAIAGLLVDSPALRWAKDGAVRQIPWPDAALWVSVRPESAKIDLNLAPRELLMGLFANLLPESDPDALAEAVLLRRQGGVPSAPTPEQQPQFRDRRSPRLAEPPRQPFASVDELVQVAGFAPASVQRLRPYLSVHSGSPRVAASAADVVVLASIPGVTVDAAQRFVEERTARSGAGARLELSEFGASPEHYESRPTSLVTNIRAVARLREGPGATVEAVVTLGRGSGTSGVLEWRDGLARAGVADASE